MNRLRRSLRSHRRLAATLVCALLFGTAQARAQTIGIASDSFSCVMPGASSAAVVAVRTTLAGVPAIVRIPKTINKPPIVLWHGLGPPASDSDLMQALPLDEVAAVKVYLGLPLFGARAPAEGAASLARRQAEDYASGIFEPVVVGAATELRAVLKTLREKKCLRPNDAIGLFGFSAGGTAVLIALMEKSVAVRAAVTVNAPTGLSAAIAAMERATKVPYTWTESARRLGQQFDAINHAAQIAAGTPPPAVLLFHGADDSIIVPSGAESLHDALQAYYRRPGDDRRLKLVIAPGVSHGWSEGQPLIQVRALVADWFNRYL